jgi:hypothetical protein
MCFGRIDRPREGLICYEGGHRRSQRAISKDDRPADQFPGRSAMVCGHLAPHEEGRPSPVRQGSPCTQGRGTRPTRALFTHPMIGKEHRSVTPTSPTLVILTPRKVTARHQLVVPSSSSDNDLSLVKHDAWVDLNPGGTRIRYTQEPALMLG